MEELTLDMTEGDVVLFEAEGRVHRLAPFLTVRDGDGERSRSREELEEETAAVVVPAAAVRGYELCRICWSRRDV